MNTSLTSIQAVQDVFHIMLSSRHKHSELKSCWNQYGTYGL